MRLIAMALLSAMLALVKISGEHGISLPESLFWRQFVPAALLFAWLALRGELHRARTQHPWLHIRRAVLGTIGMVFVLGQVRLLPLAESTILGFTTPMFAVFLAALFLRERVGPWRWGAVLLGLAGVFVIAGPDRSHLPLLGLTIGLTSALLVAVISIQLRDLGRTEEPLRIVLWFSALGALFFSPTLPFYAHAHDATGWALIAGIGLTGTFAQLFMTAALRYGRVAAVVTMDYSQLAWATLWGWLIFDQLPPTTTWLGGPLIVAAGLIIAWREYVRHRRPALDPQTGPNAD